MTKILRTIYLQDNQPYIVEDMNGQRYIFTNKGFSPCRQNKTPWN